ncbi:MAG: NAD-glutamate dehydrogenase, partial [Deltaproteobacteria bacterium]|nr:NAD-glutamate dehydrogenase [Deltaproteobacteria bacterium]
MNLRHVSQSPVSQELAHRRLEQLQGDGATDGWNAERRIVAEAIFGRAPEDYLRRTSIDTLRAIAKDTHESIKTFLREQKPYRVLVRSHDPREARGGYTSIEIVMWDRPFIVDSLTEYFRVNDIRYHVLLHPIIRSDSELVSLTYIEMDRIDEAEQLTKTIEQILDDVLLVTSSFQPIQVEIVRAHERLSADLPTTRAPETTTSALPVANEDPYAREEIVRFLEWLLDGDFIFLGSRSWTRGPAGELAERKKLGMFDSNDADIRRQLEIATGDAKLLVDSGAPIMFSKLAPRSRVHRRIYHDLVLVSVPATGDAPAEVLAIIGMHTSRAIAQDVSMIPIARRKLANLLRGEELLPNTYDYKEAVTILNLLTKSSMFRMSEQSLQQQLRIMMSIQRRGETKVLPLDLVPGRFASLLVVMPAGRFSSTVADEISEYLESKFDVPSGAIDRRVASGEESLVAIFFLVPNLRIDDIAPRMAEIERDIAEITLSWEDRLFQMLTVRSGKAVASRLLDFYWDALPDDYKASFSADEAVLDIGVLESLSGEKPIEIALRACRPDNTSHAEECVDLRIFRRGKGLTLSQTIPLLENAGFHIVDENVFVIGSAQEPWATICSLTVRPKRPTTLSAALVDERILPGLRAVFTEQAENDPLNALLANPGLTIREIAMVRLYAHYLWQIKSAPAESVISAAIVENPTLVRIFVDAFRLRFDPDLYAADMTTRLKTFAETKVRFIEALKSVSLLAHDRVLRAMFNVLESSVRTNYYQTDYQLRLAVKIDCQSVTSMPRPRPMFEIFLCSPEVEGLHLRGGKVARGGIRWSERPEDFRTEVLGLMKTQMIKNSIIVPVGAKGGFIVKSR